MKAFALRQKAILNDDSLIIRVGGGVPDAIAYLALSPIALFYFAPALAMLWKILIALSIFFFFIFSCAISIAADKNEVTLSYYFYFIRYKAIRLPLKQLCLDYLPGDPIDLIARSRDIHVSDRKHYLEFLYIMPWGGDEDELFIDYKGKEILTFGHEMGTFIWESLIEGLRKIDRHAKEATSSENPIPSGF